MQFKVTITLLFFPFIIASCSSYSKDGYEKYDYFDYFTMSGKNFDSPGKVCWVWVKSVEDTVFLIRCSKCKNEEYKETLIRKKGKWESYVFYKNDIDSNRIDSKCHFLTYKQISKDTIITLEIRFISEYEPVTVGVSFETDSLKAEYTGISFPDTSVFVSDFKELIKYSDDTLIYRKKQFDDKVKLTVVYPSFKDLPAQEEFENLDVYYFENYQIAYPIIQKKFDINKQPFLKQIKGCFLH